MSIQESPSSSEKKFTGVILAGNSAVASVGAAASMIASTGLVWPGVLAAIAGGYVGYAATNEIPRDER